MRQRSMSERRRDGRLPSYLGGRITTDRRLIAMDCVVRNTSVAGARLIVADATLLPDVFDLHIPRKNTAYRVRARWRQVDGVGVEIMPPEAIDAPVPLAMVRWLKRLEAENMALRRQLGTS
jgi:hypothetical protein